MKATKMRAGLYTYRGFTIERTEIFLPSNNPRKKSSRAGIPGRHVMVWEICEFGNDECFQHLLDAQERVDKFIKERDGRK